MASICLIRPPMFDLRLRATTVACPPLGLAYVAGAAAAAGHDVTVVDAVGESLEQMTPVPDTPFIARGLREDEILERIPKTTDVLAVSCMFSQDWPVLGELLAALRDRFPTTPIVAGGEHVTALPEYCLEDSAIDHIVLGEGEQTFVELLDAIDAGRSVTEVPGIVTRSEDGIVRTPGRPRVLTPDELARPLWNAFPIEQYLQSGYSFGVDRGRTMPIMATRGCPYQCTFCSSPQMWTTRYVTRDPKEVLQEIRDYMSEYGAQNFDFYDLTAIIKRDWILEFCRLVIDSGLEFTWQLPTGTRVEAIDDEVVALLAPSGCKNMTYAPESGSPDELKRIKKRVKLERVKDSMRSCVRAGINVKTNIVLGFPDATREDLRNTIWFLAEIAFLGVRDAMVYLYNPYPGSELYERLRDEGKLPPPSDEYFETLLSYSDLTKSQSWSEHIDDRTLARSRLVAMLVFYAVSYAVRPWRLFETLRNIVSGNHESPLERSLTGLARRLLPGGA